MNVIHLKTNPDVLKWARNSIALSKLNAVPPTNLKVLNSLAAISDFNILNNC